jgi:hypothetical protein
LLRKKEIIEALMDCLRDNEIRIIDKKEAITLIPFLLVDSESM